MALPAPDWISFEADKTEGLDLLRLRAPVQRIGNDLFNGVTTVTPKVHYLSVLAWIVWRYSEARLPDSWRSFISFTGRRRPARRQRRYAAASTIRSRLLNP